MTLSHLERSVINHLTNKGAATKFELKEALNSSKGGVQNAVARLTAIGRVEATPVKKKHNSPRGHVVYRIVAAQPKVASVNVFEHPEIYRRLHALETEIKALAEACGNLEQRLDTQRSSYIEYIEAANIFDGNMAKRLRALEKTQPVVDPLYAEIEQDITDKLGGQVSPELLRATIDQAYAERKK